MCLTGHNTIFKENVSPENKRNYWQSRVPRPLLASMKNWHKIAPSRQAKITYINKERIYLTDTEVQNSDSGQNQNQIPIETP